MTHTTAGSGNDLLPLMTIVSRSRQTGDEAGNLTTVALSSCVSFPVVVLECFWYFNLFAFYSYSAQLWNQPTHKWKTWQCLVKKTPRAAPEDRDLLRRLLTEVSEIRKNNQQPKSQVTNLTTKARRQLFQKFKDNDPEWSVIKFLFFLTKRLQSY